MDVYINELKKLIKTPALLLFLVFCIGFNLLLIISGAYYDYSDYIAEVSKTTGYVLGAGFDEKLAGLGAEGFRNHIQEEEFKDYLQADTSGVEDVFDGYETYHIAEKYIGLSDLTGWKADALRDKYEKLQGAVDKKAASDESLTLYFAGYTYNKHKELFGFGGMINRLVVECGLIAALTMLLSLGYENNNHTSHIVFATKTGRKIIYHKLFASVTAGLLAYVVLSLITLTVYFVVNDYGNIWDSSVSSVFNYIIDVDLSCRPFVTWHSFSVLTYLFAVLGITALLSICFALIAFCIGTWFRNSYLGFLVFLLINASLITLILLLPGNSTMSFIIMLTPVLMWLQQAVWFTDGQINALWANFEIINTCISLVFLAGLCAFSVWAFRRRDLA